MRLATIRIGGATRAVRAEGEALVDLGAADVGELLSEYVSTVVRLRPGDIIATGTPGGVGHARQPSRFLVGGETVVTEIKGLGRLENRVVKEDPL